MLAAHRRTADAAGIDWKAAIHCHIEEQVRAETEMNIERMCRLAKLSRAGFYRFRTTPDSGDADIDLRDAIQRFTLEFPSYGRPRITAELHRSGVVRNYSSSAVSPVAAAGASRSRNQSFA